MSRSITTGRIKMVPFFVACSIAILAVAAVFALAQSAQPHRFDLSGSVGSFVVQATPFWFNIELREPTQNGTMSSGGCTRRGVDDIKRAIEAVAMNVPKDTDGFELTIRTSWKPERPRWLGAAPNMPKLQRCP